MCEAIVTHARGRKRVTTLKYLLLPLFQSELRPARRFLFASGHGGVYAERATPGFLSMAMHSYILHLEEARWEMC